MSIITIILVLAVIGILLWVLRFVVEPQYMNFLVAIAILLSVLFILQGLGFLPGFPGLRLR